MGEFVYIMFLFAYGVCIVLSKVERKRDGEPAKFHIWNGELFRTYVSTSERGKYEEGGGLGTWARGLTPILSSLIYLSH
jgi:hypothetical protein